jgi:hypothetical protein
MESTNIIKHKDSDSSEDSRSDVDSISVPPATPLGKRSLQEEDDSLSSDDEKIHC